MLDVTLAGGDDMERSMLLLLCSTVDYCQYAQIFSKNFYHPFLCLFRRADSETIFFLVFDHV